MYYYFTCNYAAAIKINGIYYGTLCETVKSLRIDGDFAPLIEICSLNGRAQNVNFILDEQFLCTPPDNILLTDLKGGYLIKINQTETRADFNIINQQKFNGAIVTVFNENGLKISIETGYDFFAETLNLCVDNAEIIEFYLGNEHFIAVHLKSEKPLLLVYNLSKPIKKVFCREVDEFATSPTFTTTEKMSDIAKHIITSTWDFSNGQFIRKELSCKCAQDFDAEKLNENVLPFAFFEEVYAGGNYENYLSDDLSKNADKLKGFLGEFIGVIPPPKFRNDNEVGLIYKKTENKYSAEYYSVCIENNKITNIKKTDG